MVDIEQKRDELDLIHGPPLSVLSHCLRGFIVPRKGYDFIGCDFKSIEARITAWVANERRLLKLFRDGGDPYVDAAQTIYACERGDVNSDRRQVGKVAVLALGFGGGKGAFQIMAKGYGVRVTDEEAEKIKLAWRAKHPNIVHFWYALENAAIRALKTGEEIKVGPVSYRKNGSFLLCKLPSGRDIHYPYPKLEIKETPWGEKRVGVSAKWVSSLTKKWERRHLWYGTLIENIVQAIARDILVNAIVNLEDAGYEIVMHVHDDILTEIEKNISSVDTIKSIMIDTPLWAEGLPIDAKGWRGNRYRK